MAKKKKDAPDAFSRFRAGFNDDIALWQWLFDKGEYADAELVLAPVVGCLLKYGQVELLGRYAHNLGLTYQKMGLTEAALQNYRRAYEADCRVHGTKAAKRMMAYNHAQAIMDMAKTNEGAASFITGKLMKIFHG